MDEKLIVREPRKQLILFLFEVDWPTSYIIEIYNKSTLPRYHDIGDDVKADGIVSAVTKLLKTYKSRTSTAHTHIYVLKKKNFRNTYVHIICFWLYPLGVRSNCGYEAPVNL